MAINDDRAKKYRSVSLPAEMVDRIETYIEENPDLGYKTVTEFLKDVARSPFSLRSQVGHLEEEVQQLRSTIGHLLTHLNLDKVGLEIMAKGAKNLAGKIIPVTEAQLETIGSMHVVFILRDSMSFYHYLRKAILSENPHLVKKFDQVSQVTLFEFENLKIHVWLLDKAIDVNEFTLPTSCEGIFYLNQETTEYLEKLLVKDLNVLTSKIKDTNTLVVCTPLLEPVLKQHLKVVYEIGGSYISLRETGGSVDHVLIVFLQKLLSEKLGRDFVFMEIAGEDVARGLY